MSVKHVVIEWGRENHGTNTLRQTLKILLDQGLKPRQISEMFGCTSAAVRYWLKNTGLVQPKPPFNTRLRNMGYVSPERFFTAPENTRKTLKTLAQELGVSYGTISRYYNIFLEQQGLKGDG